jgi:hypothetical protein
MVDTSTLSPTHRAVGLLSQDILGVADHLGKGWAVMQANPDPDEDQILGLDYQSSCLLMKNNSFVRITSAIIR